MNINTIYQVKAKLNKRGEIPSKYASLAVLLGLFVMIVFAGCNSNHKVAESDKNPMNLSEKVEKLRQQIALDNYIGTEYIARKQDVDSAYLRKQELMLIGTNEELLALTGDPNPIVSLTAFQGLYDRGNAIVPTIFNGYKGRTDRIRFVRGDLMMELPMLEYAYVYIMNYEIPDEEFAGDSPEDKPKFELSEKEQKEAVLIIDGLRARE